MSDTEQCPISYVTLTAENTARLQCGHAFDAASITAWLKTKKICPMCRVNATHLTYSSSRIECVSSVVTQDEDDYWQTPTRDFRRDAEIYPAQDAYAHPFMDLPTFEDGSLLDDLRNYEEYTNWAPNSRRVHAPHTPPHTPIDDPTIEELIQSGRVQLNGRSPNFWREFDESRRAN